AADLDRKLTDKISATLKQSGAPSVSVALVKDGKLAFAKAFGKASLSPDRPATTDTRYAVGSISKQFTAAAILLAQEQGRLSLGDKVAKYFPDLTRAGDVTIRQLLSHTAGYEDYAPQDYIIPDWQKPTTSQAILDRWARKPLNFEPGTKWQYSNTGYVLAAAIFEKAAGQPLVSFLRARIFGPLGMASAGDCADGSPTDAGAYTRFAGGPPRPVAREASGWYLGAGELCMTPSDLAKWDMAFLRHEILSQRSYEEFTHEVRLANGDATHYALGLDIGEFNRMPTISHSGEVSGFLALNTLYPNRGGAVIVLSNEDGINLIGPVGSQVAAIAFLPEEPAASEQATQQVRTILEDLRRGKIDRALFTSNANTYFSDTALRDIRQSLAAAGKLKNLTRSSESLRGGMTHRGYRAVYEKKSFSLNIYVMPDGKYEQFMVVE
ncbi:MAG TPA: serine hydrolase domain-containing protein, partial [Candidatus Sulfopaludibacter sp.]|nr:serine hydrolase domain-containing protein [Candidatus Sulfopaludibacter sp.]